MLYQRTPCSRKQWRLGFKTGAATEGAGAEVVLFKNLISSELQLKNWSSQVDRWGCERILSDGSPHQRQIERGGFGRFDGSFRYLHGKLPVRFQHLTRKSLGHLRGGSCLCRISWPREPHSSFLALASWFCSSSVHYKMACSHRAKMFTTGQKFDLKPWTSKI